MALSFLQITVKTEAVGGQTGMASVAWMQSALEFSKKGGNIQRLHPYPQPPEKGTI